MNRSFVFRAKPAAWAAAALLLACGSASAALHGRNLDADASTFEAYYDDLLDITWLANAQLSETEYFGLPAEEFELHGISRSVAFDWIDAMNAADYLGYSDWRLPATLPIDGSDYVFELRGDGSSDMGASISAPGTPYAGSTASEMAHLYYVTLDNPPGLDEALDPTACFVGGCLVNRGPFDFPVPQLAIYWSGTTSPDQHGFAFHFGLGLQTAIEQGQDGNSALAWAVRDGDVSAIPAIPEPGTWALLVAGLGAIGAQTHRSRRAASDGLPSRASALIGLRRWIASHCGGTSFSSSSTSHTDRSSS